MSNEETVEVTIRVPKTVAGALRNFVLKHEGITEKQYWEREAIQMVMADIDFFCDKEHLETKGVLEQYGIIKYDSYWGSKGEAK